MNVNAEYGYGSRGVGCRDGSRLELGFGALWVCK